MKKRKRKRKEGSFIHTDRREVGDGMGVTTDDVAAANAKLISHYQIIQYNTIRLLLLYPHQTHSNKKYGPMLSSIIHLLQP